MLATLLAGECNGRMYCDSLCECRTEIGCDRLPVFGRLPPRDDLSLGKDVNLGQTLIKDSLEETPRYSVSGRHVAATT